MTHLSTFYPSADTYIDSIHSSINYSNFIINWIGKKNCNTSYRTLLKFNISSIPCDAVITCATLKLYVDYADNPLRIGKFTPYAITAPWEEHTVTWKSCPSFDSLLSGSTESVGGVGWYQWDLTRILNAWFKKTQENYGILIKDNDKLILDSKRLIGRKNTKQNQYAFRPVLCVFYDFPLPSCKEVTLVSRKFIDKSICVKTTDNFLPTIAFNTSHQSQVTFFVINTGPNPASLMLEIGPNDINYVIDDIVFDVLPEKTLAIVPRIFAKYARLIYKSKNPFLDTSLKIIFQSCI